MSHICKDCGTVGEPKRFTKGSIWIEIILWICFLIPGLIYSVWRLTTRFDGCRACESRNVVPLNSPLGSKLASDVGYVAPPPYRGSPAAEQFGRRIGKMFAKNK